MENNNDKKVLDTKKEQFNKRMSKNKNKKYNFKYYYAVKVGRSPGIYSSIAEMRKQTRGVSDAEKRRFNSLSEAEKYLSDGTKESFSLLDEFSAERYNKEIDDLIFEVSKNDDEVVVFTDGSYDNNFHKSGYAVVICDCWGICEIIQGKFYKKNHRQKLKSKNVAAEIEAVKCAIKWAIINNKKKIYICHDYEGLAKFANFTWIAKTAITKDYVDFILDSKTRIDIEFRRIPSHIGVYLQEQTDKLSRQAYNEKVKVENIENCIRIKATDL